MHFRTIAAIVSLSLLIGCRFSSPVLIHSVANTSEAVGFEQYYPEGIYRSSTAPDSREFIQVKYFRNFVSIALFAMGEDPDNTLDSALIEAVVETEFVYKGQDIKLAISFPSKEAKTTLFNYYPILLYDKGSFALFNIIEEKNIRELDDIFEYILNNNPEIHQYDFYQAAG